MKCAEHPQNDSIGRCADCGKEICSLCLTALADKIYCSSCIDKLISQNAEDEETIDLNKAAKKEKIGGILLFVVGIPSIIMGFVIAGVTFFSMPNMDTPEMFPAIIAGTFIGLAGCLIAIIGAILFFVGRSQAKKQ